MKYRFKAAAVLLLLGLSVACVWPSTADGLANQLSNTQEQLMQAYAMTVEFRRLVSMILVFCGLRLLAVVARIVCYILRVKLPAWLDIFL